MISLNLLPKERKEAFYWRTLAKNTIFWGARVFSILLFFSLPLLAFYLYLGNKINGLNEKILFYEQTREMREISLLEKSAKKLNEVLASVNKISENQIYWTDAFREIIKNVSSGVQIFSLEIVPFSEASGSAASSEAKFTIIGQAKTREEVLALEKNLKTSSSFKDIQSPLDNLVNRNDVEFKFTGTFILEKFKAKEMR